MYSFVGIFLIHPFQAPKEYASTPGNQLIPVVLKDWGGGVTYAMFLASMSSTPPILWQFLPLCALTSGMGQPFQNARTSTINYKRSWTLKPRVFQLSRLQRFNILPKYCIISFYRISVFLLSWKSSSVLLSNLLILSSPPSSKAYLSFSL